MNAKQSEANAVPANARRHCAKLCADRQREVVDAFVAVATTIIPHYASVDTPVPQFSHLRTNTLIGLNMYWYEIFTHVIFKLSNS